MIYSLGERQVATVGEDYFVAPSADLIGSVRLGRWASVWFNAVLRGDNEPITVGENPTFRTARCSTRTRVFR